MPKFRSVGNRRSRFLATVTLAALACVPVRAQDKPPTAREIVKAIQDHVGIPWMTQTVDTFKGGNPDTPVTGIAVTMMATLDVLQRAAANHQNPIHGLL